jgi:hypothetical protein
MMQTPETEPAMQRQASSLDVIMSTIPVPYDFDPYVARLTRDGILALLGARKPLELGLQGASSAPSTAASRTHPPAALQNRRRCSIAARSTTSSPMWRSSRGRRSTRRPSGCASALCRIPASSAWRR